MTMTKNVIVLPLMPGTVPIENVIVTPLMLPDAQSDSTPIDDEAWEAELRWRRDIDEHGCIRIMTS
jgi:hypothetical protein